MKGTMTIVSSALVKQFYYNNEQLSVNGNYQLNSETLELESINGSVNRNTEKGEYVGNFSGVNRDGEMHYTLSDMTMADTLLVLDAIKEIEEYINNESNND